MKNFIQDPLKVLLSIIGALFVFFILIPIGIHLSGQIGIHLSGQSHFEQAQETKQAIQVVNHNSKPIILETLSKENLQNGIYKLTINDSNQFIIVADYDALAIERLK